MAEPREVVLNDPNSVYQYIRELQEQIEKMKNCRNCNFDGGLVCLCETICKNKDKWELAE